MKKNLLMSACLLLTGGLYAQTPEAESPVFRLEGLDASTVNAFKTTPKEGSDELIPWTHPDTVVMSKASSVGACSKADGGSIYGQYVYTYDDRGNTLAQEALQYIAEDVWLPSQRIVSSYNQWDLVDTTTSYYYYAKDGIFMPNACKISSYDKRARRTELLNMTWNTQTDTWTKTSRFTYTYNKDNQLISSLQEEPDPYVIGGEAWKKTMKTDYAYDRQGREIRYESYFWTGTEWFPFRSIYRTYENDRLASELGCMFNDVSGVYGPTYRYDNFYNERGDLTDYLIFYYTDSTGTWDTTATETYFFNETGRNTGRLTKIYDGAYGHLENNSREFYYYNDEGVKDSVAHEEWESGEWGLTVALRYFFNEQGVCNGYIYYNVTVERYATDKFEFEFNEYGDGTRSQVFTLEDGNWAPADRYSLEVHDRYGTEILRANNPPLHEITVHYASGTKTPAPEPDTTDDTFIERLNLLLDAQVDVYPNPAAETLYVEITGEGTYDVTLSNMAGAVVEAFRMESGRKTLNVSGYKGFHVLRVAKAGATAIHKVMIL